MTFRAISGNNQYFAEESDRPLPTDADANDIHDGAQVTFTDSKVVELFDAKNAVWFPMGTTVSGSNGDPAGNVVVSDIGYTEGVLDVYDEEIYNAAIGDMTLTATGLNKYTRWMFEVSGITVDSFSLQISLDTGFAFPDTAPGNHYLTVSLAKVASAPVATIDANGLYYAVADTDSGASGAGDIFFNALFLDRAGATDTIVVRALGRV